MARNNAIAGDHTRAKHVDDPSFSAPLFLQLRLILPQRQVKKGLVHVMQRGRVLRLQTAIKSSRFMIVFPPHVCRPAPT